MEQPKYTTIIHSVRTKLEISIEEYCVADTIYHLSNNPSAKVQGWCYASKEYIGEVMGISERSVYRSIKNLVKKGLVIKDEDTKWLKTTELWYNEVIINRLKITNVEMQGDCQNGSVGVKVADTPCQNGSRDTAKLSYNNNIDNNKDNNTYTNSTNSAIFLKQKNMDTIYLDELGEPIRESSNLPKKYGGKKKIYSRIGVYYMNLKGEEGNVLRYFKDIAELYDLALKDNPEDPEKEIKAHILIAKAYYEQKNLDWGLGAVIKNWNRTKNVFRKETEVDLQNL